MKIVLISCVSKKLPCKSKARDLYISPLFKLSLKFAESLKPDKIFILSAKYGLIDSQKEIEPYDKTLNKMSSEEVKEWAESVINELKKEADIKTDEIIFLAGEKYRKYLVPHVTNYKIPLKGLSIGKQLKYLKEYFQDERACERISRLFNSMKLLKFPFNEQEIPLNGIYILFEKGESSHRANRIVRVGTHTGNNQLRPRLRQHFINENKDRSIFRKNIGRALLNKKRDPYISVWEFDLTAKKAKEKFGNLVDLDKQKEIEKQVTKYIQDNFSFVVFQVDEGGKRLEFESKIISTVSLCKDCKPSKNWLGLCSPKQKIMESGLWLVNELNKEPLSENDFAELTKIVQNQENL